MRLCGVNFPCVFKKRFRKPSRWRSVLRALLVLCFFTFRVNASDSATIRIGITAAPVTLDPRFATDVISYRICRLLYESVAVFDEQMQPRPSLMTWQLLEPNHYRFTLRSERKFSDGTVLDAQDVAATYRSVISAESRAPHKGGLAHIDAIKVIDSQTVDFLLAHPDPLFPGRLVIGVLPAERVGDGSKQLETPVGSGPFVFAAWPNEAQLELTRRSDDLSLEFITVKDPTVRVLKLARSEVDILPDGVSFDLLSWIHQRPEIRIVDAGGTTFSYLGVNFNHPLTGDHRVREAIALAIDRERIVEHLFFGRARVGVSLLPPDHWSSDASLQAYNYDLKRARELIREVEQDKGQAVELVYKTSSNPFRLRLATILADQLKKAGIKITIRSYDWGTFYGDIKAGRFELYSLSWVGLKLPDIYRYVFHSESFPPHGANRGQYNNGQVDEWIDTAESRASVAEQIPYWQIIQRQVHEDLAYIPLWYEDRVAAVSDHVIGFTLPADGNWDSLATITKGVH